MTLYQFEQLTDAQQASVINHYGVLLAVRMQAGNRIYLYSINSFYIELFHEMENPENKGIRLLKAFYDVKHLDFYLKNVDISSLSLYE